MYFIVNFKCTKEGMWPGCSVQYAGHPCCVWIRMIDKLDANIMLYTSVVTVLQWSTSVRFGFLTSTKTSVDVQQ